MKTTLHSKNQEKKRRWPWTKQQLRQRAPQCQAAAAVQRLRASRWLTSKDQKIRDGFSTKMKVLCTNFFVPKKEKLGHVSGTTAALWCLAVLSPVLLLLLVSVASLLLLASCFFFSYSCGVAPIPRILRFNLRIQHSNSLWLMSLFFLYFEFISRLDALHSVLDSLYLHTLPKEQASSAKQILFRGVMTPTLLPVRPGLHSTDVGLLWVCHCHCHSPHKIHLASSGRSNSERRVLHIHHQHLCASFTSSSPSDNVLRCDESASLWDWC